MDIVNIIKHSKDLKKKIHDNKYDIFSIQEMKDPFIYVILQFFTVEEIISSRIQHICKAANEIIRLYMSEVDSIMIKIKDFLLVAMRSEWNISTLIIDISSDDEYKFQFVKGIYKLFTYKYRIRAKYKKMLTTYDNIIFTYKNMPKLHTQNNTINLNFKYVTISHNINSKYFLRTIRYIINCTCLNSKHITKIMIPYSTNDSILPIIIILASSFLKSYKEVISFTKLQLKIIKILTHGSTTNMNLADTRFKLISDYGIKYCKIKICLYE